MSLLCVRCLKVPRRSEHASARYCKACTAVARRASQNLSTGRYVTRPEIKERRRARPGFYDRVADSVDAREVSDERFNRTEAWIRWPDPSLRFVAPIRPAEIPRRYSPEAAEHPANCAECSAVVFMLHFGMLGRVSVPWSRQRRELRSEAARRQARR